MAAVSVEHPAEAGDGDRNLFARFAERASNFSSSPAFFVLCVAIIATWALGFVAGFSDTFHHVSADVMAGLTLLLVALLKNAERRSEHAVQRKLDLIAAAMLESDSGDKDDARKALKEAIGLHDEV